MNLEERQKYHKYVSQLPSIRLDNIRGIGVILDYPSGVAYENQVGGYACDQQKREGLFVPIGSDLKRGNDDHWQFQKLWNFFIGPESKYGGHCYSGIDNEDADFIDEVLHQKPGDSNYFSVDREKLHMCMEAWIYVTVNLPERQFLFEGIEAKSGVLTWLNSD